MAPLLSRPAGAKCLEDYLQPLTAPQAKSGLTSEEVRKVADELDEGIDATKSELHATLQRELPTLQSQLSTSLSLSFRVSELSQEADTLRLALTALEPELKGALEAHAELEQRALGARLELEAVRKVREAREALAELKKLVEAGKVAEAAAWLKEEAEGKVGALEGWLAKWKGTDAIKTELRLLSSQLAEQLSDAWTSAVSFDLSDSSSPVLAIETNTKLSAAAEPVSFSDVIAALSTISALEPRLHTLQSDITKHLVQPLLPPSPPPSYPTLQSTETSLSLSPDASSHSPTPSLRALASFLSAHIPPLLPLLVTPLLSLILSNHLLSALPTSLSAPDAEAFPARVREVAEFEKEIAGEAHERPLRDFEASWGARWVVRRRDGALLRARELVLKKDWEAVELDMTVVNDAESARSPRPIVSGSASAWTAPAAPDDAENDAEGWGFDDDTSSPSSGFKVSVSASGEDDDDPWGLEDDAPAPAAAPPKEPVEGDEDDAWGWDDEDLPPPKPASEPKKPVKVASKLGAKKGAAAAAAPRSSSPATRSPSPTPARSPRPPPREPTPPPPLPPPPAPAGPTIERRLVSTRLSALLELADSLLSDVAYLRSSSSQSPGPFPLPARLLSAFHAIFDLYRALFPVAHEHELAVPALALQFANDCACLAKEVERRRKDVGADEGDKEWTRTRERLEWLGKRTLDGFEATQRALLFESLSDAAGFRDVSSAANLRSTERALSQVSLSLSRLASSIRDVIPPSRVLPLLGSLVDAVLVRVTDDVEALQDISADDSTQLCRMFRELHDQLGGLFVEREGDEPRPYVYVQSWFKFSYLSEILEASLVDLQYLFEEGALMDFSAEELVALCRALFADTAKRAQAIDAFRQGRPGGGEAA